nr:hypothetical protein [Tanacetum cinerariifolium]
MKSLTKLQSQFQGTYPSSGIDALKLTSFYKTFEITTDVPEIYMQEFWVIVSRHHSLLCFKMNGKSHTINVDNFRDMLQICPKLPGQKFEDPPFEEEVLSFIRELGHTGEIKVLSDVNVNHMHQPWRSFDSIINKCLSGKTTALESLRLSRAQILWGVYHNKNKSSDDENDDDADSQGDNDQDDDNEQTELENDGDDCLNPKLSTFDEEERHDEKQDKEEKGVNVEEEKLDEDKTNEEEEMDKLYSDVNINLEGKDTEMTDASLTNVQDTQVREDTHVIMNTVTPEAQYTSSTTYSSHQPQQQTPVPLPEIVSCTSLQNLLTFGSLFKFEDRVNALEADFLEFKQTNLFAGIVSSIPDIVDAYLANKMNEAKTLYKALIDTYETDKGILDTYGDTVMIKRRRDDEDDDEEPSAGSNWGSMRRRAGKKPESTNFLAFVMNRLKVDTLTPELLVGLTFELMKGSYKSLVELEYFLKEVYKETTDQLDWNNPEGQQYPHDLRKPLP